MGTFRLEARAVQSQGGWTDYYLGAGIISGAPSNADLLLITNQYPAVEWFVLGGPAASTRLLFNTDDIYLDGSAVSTLISSLSPGFEVLTAECNITGSFSLSPTVWAGANSSVGLAACPFLGPLTLNGLLAETWGIDVPGTGDVVAYITVTGTYDILTSTWWYNATTDHYQNVDDSPGAGWALASPDPVPDIDAVERVSVYAGGVPLTAMVAAFGCAGTAITITGSGFGDSATVTAGGVACTSVVVVDQTTITCVVGAHADGVVDVVVTNHDGVSATATGGFTYVTPWWRKTDTYVIDGVTQTFYSEPVQQCAAPVNDTQTISTPPTYDPNGWYVSTENYAGSVSAVDGGPPNNARSWDDIGVWAASNTGMLGGSPAASCTFKNRLVYPATNYTVGTDYPPIRIFDGNFDRELCRLPPTTSDTVPKAVMSMLAANGTIYLTTFDSGTTSANWVGRVFSLDIDSATLTPIGAPFTGGDMPYALCWHMGRLWLGTNNGIGTVGKVYYFRPGIDTAWTLDYSTSSSTAGGVDSLCSYKGRLFVGTDNAAASRGKVLVRSSAGAYTTSLTGTGGTAVVNNGYLAMTVFGGNLYASYWNNDGTAVAKIEKFDNTTWSTAYTGSGGTLRPFVCLFSDDSVLFAIGGGFSLTGVVLTSPDGTTWTNQTANLPESTKTLLPIYGTEIF